MKKRHLDQISGAALVAFCLVVYFVLIPAQIPGDRLGLSSSFFPEVSALAVGVLGAALFVRARLSRKPDGEEIIFRMSRDEAVRGGVVLGLMAAYVVLLHLIGFLAASPLILGALLYYSGQRSWKVIGLIIVLVPASVFAFFEYGMKIVLPRGFMG